MAFVLMLFGVLIMVTQGIALAPFVHTLFQGVTGHIEWTQGQPREASLRLRRVGKIGRILGFCREID